MGLKQDVKTRAIHSDAKEIESLYGQRQAHLSNLAVLQEQRTKSGLPTPSDVATKIAHEEASLKEIEDHLQRIGMPIDPDDLLESYESVSEALQALSSAKEIVEWIEANFPQQFRQKKDLLNSTKHSLISRLTGKWNGTWQSMSDSTESGRVIMAICQIDNELIGSGAFTNSIFSRAYLQGSIRGNSIEIRLFANDTPLQAIAAASLLMKGGKVIMAHGTYTVEGWDSGTFEAELDRATSVGTTPAIPSGVDVFISYSHKDRRSLEQKLLPGLSMLERRGKISAWYDGKIEPGTEWSAQIERSLNTAHMILLLVSADFLASDFCYSKEMTRAIERHNAGDARVIPIIVRPCDWKDAPFAKLQVLPTEGKAVTKWRPIDDGWADVAQGIRRAVESLVEHS